MGEWLAGFAAAEITPPLGLDMTGYAGRPGPGDQVWDPLWVRALALAYGEGAPLVLACIDLLGIDRGAVARIRGLLADAVPAERLLLNCSHTHSGPTTAPLRCMGRVDTGYLEGVVRRTAAAARAAVAGLQPARLSFGAAATAIGVNRRERRDGRIVLGVNEAGAYDPLVRVLRVETAAGRPLACWFSHATHPVVMGSTNTGFSAEWPGAAADALAAAFGAPAVFAQGCCGDVNPRRRGDHSVAVSVGRELAGAALVALERAEPVEGRAAGGAIETLSLPLRRPSPGEALAAQEEARERLAAAEIEVGEQREAPAARYRLEHARGLAAWAADYAAAARGVGPESVEMDVQALRVGDLAITATGAETFVEIGLEILRRSPYPRAAALGYTNGCFGYLPAAKAFPDGGYEIEGAFRFYGTLMITPDAEARTLDAAERVLERLDGGAA